MDVNYDGIGLDRQENGMVTIDIEGSRQMNYDNVVRIGIALSVDFMLPNENIWEVCSTID
jgi:hypothetical protein